MAVHAVHVAPAQQPLLAPPEPQIGNLGEREMSILRSACRDKDEANGAVVGRILSVATLIAGIYAAIVIPGVVGLLLGAAIYLIVGNLLCQTYHGLRSHDYQDAGQALHTRSFKEYIVRNELDPTIDNVVSIHKEYRKYAAYQAVQLAAPLQA